MQSTPRRSPEAHEIARMLSARTNKILIISALMFVVWQLVYFVVFTSPSGPPRRVDVIKTLGMVAWCSALLMLVATDGGAFRNSAVREVLDDELAIAHRAKAYQLAFWSVMIVALAAFVGVQFTTIHAGLLAHVLVSVGTLGAVATRAYLNRQ